MTATKAILYRLELKQPVLATDIEGEPNSAISHSYIPGALLRGVLAGLYLARQQTKSFDAVNDATARALFLSDETRFLNAYPLSQSDKRALPVPLAWRYNKEDYNEESQANWQVNDLSRDSPLFEDDRFIAAAYFQEQAIGQPFVWWEGGRADLFAPSRQLNVHTQRDAEKGRATGEEGTIYRYDALAAGLFLQGAVLTTEALAETVKKLLHEQTLWLGRARRAGYGEVEVKVLNTFDRWRESSPNDAPPALQTGDYLRLLCTSEILLRDDHGQATLDPRAALEKALDLRADALQPMPAFTWAEAKVTGGFNRKWGLPLPQSQAIAAGSVLVYRTTAPISTQQLRALEWEGIGERRNEGFGRVLVNWLPNESADFGSIRNPKPFSEAAQITLSEVEKETAWQIAQRLLRRQLDHELRNEVNYTEVKPAPHKNQLARLRVILRASRAVPAGQADFTRLRDYLANLKDTAQRQFESARVVKQGEPRPLLDWLQALLTNSQQENWLQVSPINLGDEISAPVTDELAQEYVLRLMDQVLHRTIKRLQEEGSNANG